MVHDAVLGTTKRREVQLLVGDGHLMRAWPLVKPLQATLLAGMLMSLGPDGAYPYPLPQQKEVGVGDGAEKDFRFNLGAKLLPQSITVEGPEVLEDNGCGILAGGSGGKGYINYQTGEIVCSFATAPAKNSLIKAQYQHLPQGVLTRDAETGATDIEVVTRGGINPKELIAFPGMPPSPDQLTTILNLLELTGLWSA